MPPQTKEWTIMIYFASDNPLAPGIVSQLKAIKDAGYHPEANVIAQFDPHAPGAQTHIFDVNLVNKLRADGQSRAGFPASDPYVRNLALDKLWKEEEIREGIQKSLNQNGNGGGAERHRITYATPELLEEMFSEQSPRKSLANFLRFCRRNYPARHYMLFILGHGLVVGNDLFLFDANAPQESSAPTDAASSAGNGGSAPQEKTAGEVGDDVKADAKTDAKAKKSARQNYLLLTELGEVLREFKDGRKDDDGNEVEPGIGPDSQFELVGFHSCSMSSLEVASELQGTANYMLASQGPAFVGSWPYRQILVRVFNDLSAGLRSADLTDPAGLAAKLKDETNCVSEFLRGRFDAGAARLLEQHDCSQPPDKELLRALVRELNRCIRDPELCKAEGFNALKLPEATRRLSERKLRAGDVTRLNRMLLAEAYPETLSSNPRIDVRRMLKKIFYYCLYNSHDFQLAGYSFDLCLCDLKKVPKVTDPLKGLSAALTKGLEDELAKSLILLAHWEAQSYWHETYTDLYDFCFCLHRRCEKIWKYTGGATLDTLRDIYEACDVAMNVLKRPPLPEEPEARKAAIANLKDGLVVAAQYAGPAYQYSHGLSVYFPWSKPADEKFWKESYRKYRFDETGWGAFLEAYFEKTLRDPHRKEAEGDPRQILRERSTEELLLEEITVRVVNEVGHLGKGGGNDVTGKGGGNDPTGGDCDCPPIKNHPNSTRVSPNFFHGMKSS